MSTPHKATAEQWSDAGAFASDTRAWLLALRARVEALEEAENDRRFEQAKAIIDRHAPAPASSLVEQWLAEGHHQDYCSATEHAIAQAARWGADQRGDVNDAKLQEARDQELEGCCDYIGGEGKWFANPEHRLTELRAARRPKPPSLKEQALIVLDDCAAKIDAAHENTLRRALEALDD